MRWLLTAFIFRLFCLLQSICLITIIQKLLFAICVVQSVAGHQMLPFCQIPLVFIDMNIVCNIVAVSILGTKICFQRTQSLHYKAGGWQRSKSRVCQLGDCGSCPVWECCVLCFTLVSSEGNLQGWIMKPAPKTAVSWVPTAGWLQKWVSHHRPQFTAEMKLKEVLSLTDTRP